MSTSSVAAGLTVGRVRYGIVAMLFAVTAVNYADRAVLAIAGPALSRDLGIGPLQMGFVFSAFGWSYVLGQIPGGWALDRFGPRIVYFASILIWSVFTILQGGVWVLGASGAVAALFILRLLVGLAEAPSFPANGRITAAWFPARERGTASAIFNSAQYFATVLFAPIMGFITVTFGWPEAFYFMGGLGVLVSFLWLRVVYDPRRHPTLGAAELAHIEAGGALVARAAEAPPVPIWSLLGSLLRRRMMIGIFLGQFCINALTYFFITWFPIYLVQQRGMSILNAGIVASIPAICGFGGGVLGGIWSDAMLRRGWSLTAARKTPIVAGMLMSTAMVLCNYTDVQWVVVAIMALAFFGKGVGALGWAVMADTVPREIAGLSAGLFNMFGNISSITTPIIIGYIIQRTGSFDGALVFIGLNALVAIVSYVLVVGEIKRVEFAPGDLHA